MQVLLIGLGAGVASALLFVSLASGSALAIVLFYLAPLPIMLAGLGWSPISAMVATLTAAAGLGAGAGLWFLLAYLAGVGIPAYVLSYLAMLGRPAANGNGMEWYPAGRIVLWGAIIAAATTALTVPAFGLDLESYHATLKQIFERVLRIQLAIPQGDPLRLPNGADPQKTLDVLAVAVPPMAAALSMVTNLANLWLAGRIARASGKLARPWPDLAAISLPSMTPFVLLVLLGLSLISSLVGMMAGVLAACLLLAYALLGLAVLHAVTRGFAARRLILSLAWIVLLVLGWPIAIFALVGLADGILDLRGKINPPNSNLPNQPKR